MGTSAEHLLLDCCNPAMVALDDVKSNYNVNNDNSIVNDNDSEDNNNNDYYDDDDGN